MSNTTVMRNNNSNMTDYHYYYSCCLDRQQWAQFGAQIEFCTVGWSLSTWSTLLWAACEAERSAHAHGPAGIQTFFIEDQRLALWHHHAREWINDMNSVLSTQPERWKCEIKFSAVSLAERGNAGRERRELKKAKRRDDLIVSLSLGAPVHCPAVSVGPEPGPLRRRPAAANTESSSSQHPESSHLPFCFFFLI